MFANFFPAEAQRIYVTARMADAGNGMRRTILIIAVLMALVILSQSKSMVDLGGKEANLIFGKLSNNSTTNSSLNLSRNSSVLSLGGDGGDSMLKDLENVSKNLSDWGSAPPKAPKQPTYDPKLQNTIDILRANHGF
ncbi:MAG TPA: hypothetical protein PKK68_09120 [Methanothrix soehngenii]|jgi:hypothetical protein|nr:hypothetical protein [Methanothrix soehngenii]